MQIALVSIGHCPSLALRNIRRYCLAHEEVRRRVSFSILDYNLRDFRDSRAQSAQQWSFVTRFDEAVQEICRTQPTLVAFSCYLWNTELSLHLAHLLKRTLPNVCIVFGGPDAGPRALALLYHHPQVDIVVEGDGEIPFLELLRRYLAGTPGELSEVPSLRYRGQEGPVVNPVGSQMVDMSLLVNASDEPPSAQNLSQWPWPYLLVETLRGCPYSCSYCMYGKTRMNEKDPDTAAQEIAGLLRQGALVEIVDPTFTTYQKRAKQILRSLSRGRHEGRLCFEVYPDSIDEEMADLIALAPVSCLGIGFQTLSAEGLRAVKRPRNLARFERAVSLLRARRIQFYVDIIYGLPGTTRGCDSEMTPPAVP